MLTKVYFYGETKEETFAACGEFIGLLNDQEFKSIKKSCYLDFEDICPPLPCYKFRCYLEYQRKKDCYCYKGNWNITHDKAIKRENND